MAVSTCCVAACDGQPLWRCIGTNAGTPWSELGGEASWGTVRPALGDVNESALGLTSFAASVAGYFNDPDITRSRWENDPAFIPWLDGLADTSSGVSLSGGSALGTMATRPSALDMAATAGFELAERRCRLTALHPQLSCSGDVVAGRAGRARRGCYPAISPAELTEQLRTSGWDDAATAATPVPSASTMLALRAYWNDAV